MSTRIWQSRDADRRPPFCNCIDYLARLKERVHRAECDSEKAAWLLSAATKETGGLGMALKASLAAARSYPYSACKGVGVVLTGMPGPPRRPSRYVQALQPREFAHE